jgi:hypothetical protein
MPRQATTMVAFLRYGDALRCIEQRPHAGREKSGQCCIALHNVAAGCALRRIEDPAEQSHFLEIALQLYVFSLTYIN